MTGWAAEGVAPTPGVRYEFEDFVGARFTATLATWSTIPTGHGGVALRLTFDDRQPFETNLPIRFREVPA